MSEEVNLCEILLKQHFGDVVADIGRYLIKGGAKSLRFISRDVNCSLKNIKKALCILLHHNLAAFSVGNNNIVQYEVFSENVLLLSRYPKYCHAIKQLYGEAAEVIVKEILFYGRLEMSKTIEILGKRLTHIAPKTIHDTFKDLVSTYFLKKCPAPLKSWKNSDQAQPSTVPNLEISEDRAFIIVDINLKMIESNIKSEAQANIKTEECEENPPPVKRQKVEEIQPDASIYWRVNLDRFHQLFRDQAIVKLAATRVDEFAGEIVRAILRKAETNTPYGTTSTNPISRYEIIDLIKNDNTSTSKDIDRKMDSYLAILVDDASKFVTKYDERSGGMFIIDFGKALQVIAEANLTSVVQDRYGSKCCRIFRLLLMKKYLDQKQIEEMSMIPAKDAKEYTYKLLKDNIIVTKEIPQTPDFAPSRTFFLFYVDLDQLGRMVMKWIYKAMYNAISCSMHENKQNKRLLEKQVTVELVINKLQSENAMEEQIREMNDVITQPERELLNHLRKISLKLAASQMQLDDTLFVLTSYIESLTKFPISTGKKS